MLERAEKEEELTLRKSNKAILWPVYLDSTKTRAEGRKVPKRAAKQAPTLSMVQQAVAKLGLSYEVIPDAAHPYFPWKKTGAVIVEKNKSKSQILKDVAAALV